MKKVKSVKLDKKLFLESRPIAFLNGGSQEQVKGGGTRQSGYVVGSGCVSDGCKHCVIW